MKSVMISIQPKMCELIANGEKTIEVRKTRPNIETPFKCYIYCTAIKDKKRYSDEFDIPTNTRKWLGNGKVIGEFVCDKIEKFTVGTLACDDIEKAACLTYAQMIDYFYKPNELDGNTAKFGYAWHITDLKIYDEPKELKEFVVEGECNEEERCLGCNYFHYGRGWLDGSYCDEDNCEIESGYKPLIRPPQSWQYCEEL